VNEIRPETFSTKPKGIRLSPNEPGEGWLTEVYKGARVMIHPDNDIIIQADDPELIPVFAQAYDMVVAGGIHQH
jgi:hypothetical protein